MHRKQCKFIKIERKLHYVVSLPIPSCSSPCVRCVPPCGAFGLGPLALFSSRLLLRAFVPPLFSFPCPALFNPSFLALPSRWPCLWPSCLQSSSSSPPHRRPVPRGVGPLCPPHGTRPSPFLSRGGLAFPYAGLGSMPRPPWWASWGRPRWLPTLGGFERVRWFRVGLGCFGVGLEVAGLGGKAFLGHEVVEEVVGVFERFGVVRVGQVVAVSLEAG